MPTHDPTRQRDFALDVVKTLREAGFEALWAGGCVRDQLLGLEPKDYDVATNATPDAIRRVFGRRRTLAIGAAFGVVTVLGPRRAGQIEVATFRSDSAYSDGRHPDQVTFTDAEHDALRRDFTINGLFYDPLAEKVIDYVGGREDLAARIVRAIGDPVQRFAEDKLRMLRTVRIAAAFDFHIEEATLQAVRQMAGEISTVSAERIGMEVRRMLVDARRRDALVLLKDTGLLSHVMGELAGLDEGAWQECLRVAGELKDPSLAAALAAVCLQTDKPRDCAGTIGRRLRYANRDVERAEWLVSHLETVRLATEVAWPKLQPMLVHDGAGELLALLEAVAGQDDQSLRFCREQLRLPADQLNPPPLVDGSDLIARGLAPGPEFSTLLDKTRAAQLERRIATKDEALAYVDTLLQEDN